jgi:hypothetical protein
MFHTEYRAFYLVLIEFFHGEAEHYCRPLTQPLAGDLLLKAKTIGSQTCH